METKLMTNIDNFLQTHLPNYNRNDRAVQLDDCARFLNEELYPDEVIAKNFHKVTVGEAFREYLEVLTELLDDSIRSALNNACELQKRNCLDSLDESIGKGLMEWEDFKEAIMSAPQPLISESNTIPYLKINETTKEVENTQWKGNFLSGKVVDLGGNHIRVVVNFDYNEKSEDYNDTIIEFVKDKIEELEDTKYAVYFCYKENSIDVFIKELRSDVALRMNDEFQQLFKGVTLEQIVGSPKQATKDDPSKNIILVEGKLFLLSQNQKSRFDKGKMTKIGIAFHNGKNCVVFAQKSEDGKQKVEYRPTKQKQANTHAKSKSKKIAQ